MAKDKVMEEITKTANKPGNIIIQYYPAIVGLICLIVSYLLFKKIQTLNSHSDTVNKMEKQFVNYAKEQSELNNTNSKKFNSIMNQIKQMQQMQQTTQETQQPTQVIQQPTQAIQREPMPTSVIQTNYPIKQKSDISPPNPIITTNKKVVPGNTNIFDDEKKKPKKKVVELHKEVLVEEVSSDED